MDDVLPRRLTPSSASFAVEKNPRKIALPPLELAAHCGSIRKYMSISDIAPDARTAGFGPNLTFAATRQESEIVKDA